MRSNTSGRIRLNGMEFYAYHGCYPEEQIIGNRFLVDLTLETDTGRASESDNLDDALNYATVYESVKHEMNIRSHLLEHVAGRILDRIFAQFPQLQQAEVTVAKLNPPLGGKVESVSVSLGRARNVIH